MSKRMWVLLAGVVGTSILVGVVLGGPTRGEEALRELPSETEDFIELKFEMLTLIEVVDPDYTRASHFEVLALPAVQARPGQSMQVTWSGPRDGSMMEVRIECTPSVSNDSRILLADLRINWEHPGYGKRGGGISTGIRLLPGKPLMFGGGTSQELQKSHQTLTKAYRWQVTAYWPVARAGP